MSATYQELYEKIRTTAGRYNDETKAMIPGWVHMVEQRLARKYRDGMEFFREVGGVFDGLSETITLPVGSQYVREIRINSPLAPHSLTLVSDDKFTDVQSNSPTTGDPLVYMLSGERTVRVAPVGTDQLQYTVFFTGQVAEQDQTRISSELLREAEDVLLYGTLLHMVPYAGEDVRFALWKEMRDDAEESVAAHWFRKRTGGGPLRVRPDTVPLDGHTRDLRSP